MKLSRNIPETSKGNKTQDSYHYTNDNYVHVIKNKEFISFITQLYAIQVEIPT